MIIFPNIELQKGKCVNLVRGSMDDPIVYDVDPIKMAKDFEAAGAEWLQIVDLDGVMQGGEHNGDVITEIAKTVKIPVQVGGGIRTIATVQWWLDRGLERVVLGTAAVKDRHLVDQACGLYPGKILVSLDARDGYVMIEGWREQTAFTAHELAKSFEQKGMSALIYTDIDHWDADDWQDSDFANTTQLATDLDMPVIASGVVKTLDDISRLKFLPNIAGAIVGRALFEKTFTLEEALEIARQKELEAEFI